MAASIKGVALALLLGLSCLGHAEDDKPYTVPIEWQKVELQKQLEESISRSVQTVIDRAKFHVTVELKIANGKSIEAGSAAAGQAEKNFPLAKLGLNRESAAYKKAISDSSDNVFTRIAGIAVNLSLDSSVPGSAERQAKESIPEIVKAYSSSALDLKVKRMGFFIAPPIVNSGEAEVAKANLDAAKALAEAISQSNGKIAEAINLIQSRQPAAESEKKSVETKVTQEAPKAAERVFPKDWRQALLEFQIPIGILVATLLFMISIGGFKKIESQKVAVMAAGNQARAEGDSRGDESGEQESRTKDPGASAGAASGGPVSGASGGGENAFDQFRRISEGHVEAASFLLKSWVNMDTDAAREAIAAVTKAVPFQSLIPVVQSMTEDLKNRFKQASQTPIDAAAMARAEGFIVEQLIENFLVNAVELPDEVNALMSGMSISEALECVKKDKRLGGIFVNVLQTAQVVKLLKTLPDAEVAAVLQEGVKYGPESIQYLVENLQSVLSQLRQGKQAVTSPLVRRSVELVGFVGPEREAAVVQMMLASGAKDQVVEASMKYYPAEILLTFPPEKLRVLMGAISTKQRAALIHTRNEKDKKILLAAIGEQGRMREIINEELREIEKSETLKAQLKKNQAKVWIEFVTAARQALRTDSRVKDVGEELLKKWLTAKGIDANKVAAVQAAS